MNGSSRWRTIGGIVLVVMRLAPTTHFVQFAQAILYRGCRV